MAVVLGLNAKLICGGEIKNVKDVTLTLETGEADVTTRAAQGWRATASTLKEATLEFTVLCDTEDTAFEKFRSAFLSGDPQEITVSNGDGAGGGLTAKWVITGFSIDQPLEEAVSATVTAKVTASDTPPTWA